MLEGTEPSTARARVHPGALTWASKIHFHFWPKGFASRGGADRFEHFFVVDEDMSVEHVFFQGLQAA